MQTKGRRIRAIEKRLGELGRRQVGSDIDTGNALRELEQRIEGYDRYDDRVAKTHGVQLLAINERLDLVQNQRRELVRDIIAIDGRLDAQKAAIDQLAGGIRGLHDGLEDLAQQLGAGEERIQPIEVPEARAGIEHHRISQGLPFGVDVMYDDVGGWSVREGAGAPPRRARQTEGILLNRIAELVTDNDRLRGMT